MSKKSQKKRQDLSAVETTISRLLKAPETAGEIYELAESLYMCGESAGMSISDITRINDYLQRIESDMKLVKRQFQTLSATESGFDADEIPVGF